MIETGDQITSENQQPETQEVN